MFQTPSVHHQERFVQAVFADFGTWYYCAYYSTRPAVAKLQLCNGCSSSFTLITTRRIETYQITTNSIRTLLKMDCSSPKYVELLNVMNKIKHQILCILLDYICIYIAFGNFANAPEKTISSTAATHNVSHFKHVT